jgi:PKD repeat protein
VRPCNLLTRLSVRLSLCLSLVLAACSNEPTVISTSERPTGPLLAIGTDPVSGATLETNKDDYMPGEVVHLTGHGWAANETIALFMSEEPNTHEDVTSQVVADSAGAFTMHFYDVQQHDLGVTFTLTATGLTSGSRATAVFTDGATVLSIVSISPASPAPSALFDINASVDVNGSGGGRIWKGTRYDIDGGTSQCYNNTDVVNVNGTYPITITGVTAPATAGAHTIHMAAYEDDLCTSQTGGNKSFAFTVSAPANTAPVVSAGADATINEGAPFSQNGSFTDPDANSWTATVDYGDGSGVQPLTLSGKTFTLSHTYAGSGNYTVTVTVTDDDGGVDSDEVIVNVANTAPVVSAGGDAAINEGGAFSQNGSFTDPDANSWTATVDYGDGSGVQTLALSGKNFSLSHVYADNGTFTVTVTVNDGTASGSDGVVVTVANVAPVVSAGADATINEGGTFSQSGSFTDPGADTWTATVDYGDGSGVQTLALSGKTFSLSHVYADNGSYTVTVTVNDDDAGTDSDQVTVTVNNVAPTITSLTVPLNPVAAGPNNVTVTWAFTDPGTDTWTCEISWDAGLPFEAATYVPTKSCSATKTLPAGIYSVTVKVTDDDGGTDTEPAATYIVVYDPNGGFVTGGGWITSPGGAYAADGSLSGKATFGFVSKYQKGATTPTGNTEFQFHVASMNFKSTVYEWLVVAGARGQYKGSGTINGSGDYGFLLTAIDGQLNGGGGADKFRIKIWDKGTNTIVYDNQMGALEDSPAATVISGGSIVIHSK